MAKHVIVIGAGVIGLATAYYCARRGWRVTVVERHPEKRDACSFGNAGMIVTSHFIPLAAPGMFALALKWMSNPASPFYIKPRASKDLLDWGFKFWCAATRRHVERAAPLLRDLSFASRWCYEELAASTNNEFGLAKNGLLTLCKTADAMDEEAKLAEHAHRLRIRAMVLDPAGIAALDPAIRMDVIGGVYYEQDCHMIPPRLVATLQNLAASKGVDLRWSTEVIGWRVERGRRLLAIKTIGGDEIEADEFVLCGGSWSPRIVRELGLSIPIQPGKGYSLTLPKPRQLPRICAILSEARVAVTPMAEALRFAGTMEIAGFDDQVNPVRVKSIVDAASRYYPDFQPADFEGVAPWFGLRPCSPDGMPYIGRTSKFANLSIAAGHAMMGMSIGPITGKIIADILSGDIPPFDLNQLSPDRY